MNGSVRWKRLLATALILWALPLSALGADWGEGREIHCREHLAGCRLLQMVMMGSFEGGDPEDAVTQRVLASAYPRLLEVTEADISHFAQEFGETGENARLRWYGALANCLRAEIAQEAQPTPARQVLALFLNPAETPRGEAARAEIRREMSEEVIGRIADDILAPTEFVRWVLEGD